VPNNKISGMLNAKKPMRHFSRILFLLGATFSSIALSHAQTLTVTDNSVSGNPADHGPYQHWGRFYTTLSAKVDTPPKPEAELRLGGMSYLWSGGNGVVSLSSYTDQTVTLQSSFGTELKPYGQNNIAINCTVTYSELDAQGNFVKFLPGISGSITVKFWSTVPQTVKQIDKTDGMLSDTGAVSVGSIDDIPSPFYGPDYWGHADRYHLQIRDNEPTPEPYSFGKAREEFPSAGISPAGTQPNGARGPSTWPVGSDFTDYISVWYGPGPNPGWAAMRIMVQFDQQWWCMEAKPPTTSTYDQSTQLNMHHVTNYAYSSTRTGG